MEKLKIKKGTPEELAKKGAIQRREAFKKTEAERKGTLSGLHQKETNTSIEVERLQSELEKVKNEKERNAIYARLAKLVEEKKKINKEIKKTKTASLQSEKDAKLRAEEIYGSQNAEAHVGTGQFEQRTGAESKNLVSDQSQGISAEDLETIKKEIYSDGDGEGSVGTGQFEYRKSSDIQKSDKANLEANRKINEEMKALKKRAKELEAKGTYSSTEESKKIDEKPAGSEAKNGEKTEIVGVGTGVAAAIAARELGSKLENGEEGKDEEDGDLLAGEGWSNVDRTNRRTIKNVGSRGEKGLPSNETQQKWLNDLERKSREMTGRELEEKLKLAREAFAKKDYETNNTWQKLRRILRLKTTTPGNLQETHWEANQYKIAKIDLMKHRVDELQNKNLSPDELKKEMGDLAKFFQEDEKMELFAARTSARAKSIEEKYGKAPGKFMEVCSKFTNWHRKLNWKKKMAFNMALGLSGVGIAILANRVVGGAVSGAGVTGGLEARYRGKEKKRLAKEREKMIQDTETGANPEEKLNILMAKLEAEGNDFQKHLKREQNEARKRRIYGAAVAAFIGSGAAGYLLRWTGEKTGVSDVVRSKMSGIFGHHSGTPSNVPGGAPKPDISTPGSVEHGGNGMGQQPRNQYSNYYYDEFKKGGGLSDGEKAFGGNPSTGTMPLTEDEAYAKIMKESKRRAQEAMKKAMPGIPNDDSYMNPGAAHIDNIQHSPNVPHSPYETAGAEIDRPGGSNYYREPIGKVSNSDMPNHGVGGGKEAVIGGTSRAFSAVEVAGKGNKSVWEMVHHQLEGRYGASYNNLGPEQKANIISTFTNQVGKNPGAFGLKDIDTLKAGQKVDFSRLFENGQKVHGVFDHAEHLKPEQIDNIRENNKSILRWLKAHPGERLTTPKVAEILEHRGGGTRGVGAATEQATAGAGRPAPNRMPFYEPQGGKDVYFNPKRGVSNSIEKYLNMKGVDSTYAHQRALQLAGETPKLETAPNGDKTWVFEKSGTRVEMTPDGKHIKGIVAPTEIKGGRPVMPSETAVRGVETIKGSLTNQELLKRLEEMHKSNAKALNDVHAMQEMLKNADEPGGIKKQIKEALLKAYGAATKEELKLKMGIKSVTDKEMLNALKEFFNQTVNNVNPDVTKAAAVIGIAGGGISGLRAIKDRNERKRMETVEVNFSNSVGNELQAYQDAKERKDKNAEDLALQVVFKKMRETMIGRSGKIKSIGDLQSTNAQEFLSAKANSREPLVRHAKFFEVAYGSVTRPLKDETLDVWTKRMVKTIIRSSEKQEDLLEKAA